MVASVGRITAGRGYDYLTKEVATSKHDYYTGAGEAPGQWTGRGSALLGLAGEVDADDMAVLYGRFVVPSTAGNTKLPSGRLQPETVLGRKVSARKRPDGTIAEPVAAFDVTFSPSKSVSVLWALTDQDDVKATIEAAHERAVTTALDYLDAHAGHTRTGPGGVRKIDGDGFVIAQFRHRTARSTDPGRRVGDPQLHSHCAILNRIRGVDGKWRTLDGAAIYRHAHAAGGVYAATFEAELSERLGIVWADPGERVPMREIDGVPDAVRARFSTRRADVLDFYDSLDDEWRAVHGRSPTRDERARMHEEATVRSRAPKTGGNTDLHGQWRAECSPDELDTLNQLTTTSADAAAAPGSVAVNRDGGRLSAGSDDVTDAVFARLHEQRAWWTRANIAREVADLIADPSLESIEVETERIAALCVQLEVDDDDEYADRDAARMSSATIIDAETRVLDSADQPTTLTVPAVVDERLGDDQRDAVRALTETGRQVQTIVGPAGAGKTTMLQSVASSWEAAERSVMVLALSAKAARVVTEETGLPADTIAMWRNRGIDIPRNGLVLVDEASMVPTLALDELIRVAGVYNTRVGLLGDYAQMGAPEAGGLLRDLADKPHTVQLVAVRRFSNEWERDASKQLRAHDPDVTTIYDDHGRIQRTATQTATVDVCDAWFADTLNGADSLIVVDTAAAAAELSGRCQELLRVDDRLGERVADSCADNNPLYIGDLIQTRRNTRTLTTSDGSKVNNRDVWAITGTDDTGRIRAKNLYRQTSVTIDPDYLEQHVVLAYATTIAGAQGRTTDTGHVLVTPATSSSSLYVGMTRGRHHNTAHTICDSHDHAEFELGNRTPTQAFREALTRTGDGERSAHRTHTAWNASSQQRRADRNADRQRRSITDEWNTHRNQMPAHIQQLLDGHDHNIINQLERIADPTTRERTLRMAIRSNDWTRPNAGRRLTRIIEQSANQHERLHQDRYGTASPDRTHGLDR